MQGGCPTESVPGPRMHRPRRRTLGAATWGLATLAAAAGRAGRRDASWMRTSAEPDVDSQCNVVRLAGVRVGHIAGLGRSAERCGGVRQPVRREPVAQTCLTSEQSCRSVSGKRPTTAAWHREIEPAPWGGWSVRPTLRSPRGPHTRFSAETLQAWWPTEASCEVAWFAPRRRGDTVGLVVDIALNPGRHAVPPSEPVYVTVRGGLAWSGIATRVDDTFDSGFKTALTASSAGALDQPAEPPFPAGGAVPELRCRRGGDDIYIRPLYGSVCRPLYGPRPTAIWIPSAP